MKKWVNAEITWISKEEGGRRNKVPVNARYCPIIIFENDTINGGSWSADIFVTSHVSENKSMVRLSYLVEEAPFDKLTADSKFELREGSKLVATGIIKSTII